MDPAACHRRRRRLRCPTQVSNRPMSQRPTPRCAHLRVGVRWEDETTLETGVDDPTGLAEPVASCASATPDQIERSPTRSASFCSSRRRRPRTSSAPSSRAAASSSSRSVAPVSSTVSGSSHEDGAVCSASAEPCADSSVEPTGNVGRWSRSPSSRCCEGGPAIAFAACLVLVAVLVLSADGAGAFGHRHPHPGGLTGMLGVSALYLPCGGVNGPRPSCTARPLGDLRLDRRHLRPSRHARRGGDGRRAVHRMGRCGARIRSCGPVSACLVHCAALAIVGWSALLAMPQLFHGLGTTGFLLVLVAVSPTRSARRSTPRRP